MTGTMGSFLLSILYALLSGMVLTPIIWVPVDFFAVSTLLIGFCLTLIQCVRYSVDVWDQISEL